MAAKVQYLFINSKNKMKKPKTGSLTNQMKMSLKRYLRKKLDDVKKRKGEADSELEYRVSPLPNRCKCKKSTVPNKR
jgi:hypothetical protein